MKKIWIVAVVALAGCAPAAHDSYCSRYGVEKGNPEYAACTQYFFANQAEFDADRRVCEREADLTYPQSLYSRPMSYPVRVYSPYRGYSHTEMVHVGADYQQNSQLDALRMNIIEPCMEVRGWNSGFTWEAGRHAANSRSMKQPRPAKIPPLPWLKK